ncbi:restriction endonuclease subunit S [Bradyrhizobium sp. RDM4]|uniref:restriction endonuclease subunit S n=1 Tax=Bradyrhizobium sp. RDM4 TaxID=3378765 RepID=UPI0038FCCEF7
MPHNWQEVSLGALSTFENGDRSSNYPSGSDIKSEGIPFFSTKNLSNLRLQFSNIDFITEEKFKSLRSGKLRDQDILITLRGSVGKFGLFEANDQIKTGFINAQLLIVRSVERAVVPYLMMFMRSDAFADQLSILSSGSTTPQLSVAQLSKAVLPLPPLTEQHRIVAKVNELIVLCDRLEASLTAIAVTRRRLLDALLAEAVAPNDDRELEAAE